MFLVMKSTTKPRKPNMSPEVLQFFKETGRIGGIAKAAARRARETAAAAAAVAEEAEAKAKGVYNQPQRPLEDLKAS
jgi:hypothetical protein